VRSRASDVSRTLRGSPFADGERVVVFLRFHPARLAPIVVLLSMALLLSRGVFPSLRRTDLGQLLSGTVAVGVETGLALWSVLRWWLSRVIVTDQRLAVRSGVIVRTLRSWPLGLGAERIRFVRTPFGAALGYGTLMFRPPGRRGLSFRQIPAPEKIYIQLTEILYSLTFFRMYGDEPVDDGEQV
jgi:hypothetical protein